jgi:hypothetical protein
MTPYSSGNGCNATKLSANTTGTLIAQVGGQAATTAAAAAAGGFLRSFIYGGGDSSAETVTIYDGTSTSGTVIAVLTFAASSNPVTVTFDVQLKVGLYVVISGGTAVNDTVVWA